MEQVLFAFGLTLFAGLSTTIGSLLAITGKRTNEKFLCASLGFSAGIMIFVSMIEIYPKAQEALVLDLGLQVGSWVCAISFFAGMFLIGLIDRLVPKEDNPHEVKKVEEYGNKEKPKKLMRMGMLTALAIAIHNFPEGIATFISAMQDVEIAIPIAIAIAIHNIPEGIAVAAPIYYATGDKKKAFWYSFLSGLSEPVGAIIGYFFLMPFLSETLFGIVFSMVGGIMVFISLDELLPTAREYGHSHLVIYSLVVGMMVMSLSLLLFI